MLEAGYRPTLAECAQLAAPIAYFLGKCSCYDMLGMSTQEVVLDVEAPLAVAFIAAQETRVQSCVLWDSLARKFVGVLTSTDYIKILLYCQSHSRQAEEVPTWTIRHWCAIRNKLDDITPAPATAARGKGAPSVSPLPTKTHPAGMVTCTTGTPLKECLEIMMQHNVRRIVVLAEKEGESFSLVAMMDMEHIVEYLGAMFFQVEKSGGSLWRQSGSPNTIREHTSGDDESVGARLGGSSASPSGGLGSDDTHDVFAIGEGILPPHVTSILSQVESVDASNAEPAVGPYRSMFDIPFMYTPSGVGAHRSHPIYVTMDGKLNDALSLLLQYHIESIAVCTPDTEEVVEVVSRSDLLRMENQGVYDTNLTVREALASKISEGVFVFYERESLRDIFTHFVRHRVKELFLVDPDTGRLMGQLNISEFMLFLVFAHIQ